MCLIRNMLCFTVIISISILSSKAFTGTKGFDSGTQLNQRYASKNSRYEAPVIARRPTHKFTREYSDSETSSTTGSSSERDSVGGSIFHRIRMNYQLQRTLKDGRPSKSKSRQKLSTSIGKEHKERSVAAPQEGTISTTENRRKGSHRENQHISALDIDKITGNYHAYYSSGDDDDDDNDKTPRRVNSKNIFKRTSAVKNYNNVPGTGTKENKKRLHSYRQNFNLPALDIDKITGNFQTYHYSSPSDDDFDDDGTPRRQDSKNILKQSSAEKYRNAHGSDGSWIYARNLQKKNKLNDFCTSVQLISGYGFAFVNDGHLMKGYLRLGEIEIYADIVRFSSSKMSTKRIFYITKGLRPDCVFLLSVQDPDTNLFSLGKHFCYITGPTPLHKNQKGENL